MKLSKHSAQKSSLSVSSIRAIVLAAIQWGVYAQGLSVLLLLLLGQAVLGLRDLKLAVAEQSDEADTQVCAAQVES
jgi:hypothetical protein